MPALMNNAGVVTAINSDSAEMSRRLNQEAAKSIKYGGTIRRRSLEIGHPQSCQVVTPWMTAWAVSKSGKDADLVLWSDNPLSIYAKAEKTLVDGM